MGSAKVRDPAGQGASVVNTSWEDLKKGDHFVFGLAGSPFEGSGPKVYKKVGPSMYQDKKTGNVFTWSGRSIKVFPIDELGRKPH